MPTDTPTKPKPPGKLATNALTPTEQLERFHGAVGSEPYSEPSKPKPPGKLGAEKLTPEEQRRRFIEAAREVGASEDEADFDAALKAIARSKGPAPF